MFLPRQHPLLRWQYSQWNEHIERRDKDPFLAKRSVVLFEHDKKPRSLDFGVNTPLKNLIQ